MRINSQQAILKLQRGEVVAIPTETVYGLAADATNENALRQIYKIKERPQDNPLIVHIADSHQVQNWAEKFPRLAQKFADIFWPGPLTLVLPAKNTVSSIVRGGLPTVALRVPNHPLTLSLLKESGLALAAPSANKFTQLSPTTAAHVGFGLGEQTPVVDGGACQVGIESTIIAIENDDWRLLRLGMISEASLTKVTGKKALKDDKPLPKSPGQHLLHYSPCTPLRLFKQRGDVLAFSKTQTSSAVLLMQDEQLPNAEIFVLPKSPILAAIVLYDLLHQMDALKVDCILVELPPDTSEWAAIHDRFNRAAYKS